MLFRFLVSFFVVFSLFVSFFDFVLAERIESDSFIVPSDTVTPGNFSSSDNFRMFSNITQISIGRNSSDAFDLSAGFLSFPEAAAAAAAAAEAAAAKAVTSSEGIVLSLLKNFLTPRPLSKIITTREYGVADINQDGKVDIKDLGAFLYFIPQKVPTNPADFNKDGIVNSKDFSFLLSKWTERFIAFKPDKAKISIGSSDTETFNPKGQQNSITPLTNRSAEVSSSVSSKSLIIQSKKGFSALLRNAKSFTIKVFLVIKSIF